MADTVETERGRPVVALPRGVTVAIIGTFVILLLGALYYARGFVLPIFIAALVTLAFSPTVRRLRRRGVPAPVSAALVVLLIGGSLAGVSYVIADPVAEMVDAAPRVVATLRERFDGMRGPLAKITELQKQAETLAEPGPGAPQKVVLAQPGVLSWAADTLSGIGSTLAAALILVVFLLSSGDAFLQKLVRAFGTLSDKKRSLRIVHDVENEVSRYLLTITLINIGFGVSVGLAMWALGMPSPLLWGFAAALLNYIPYLGTITGIALAGAVGLVTYPTVAMALFPPAAYLALNLVENLVVTPLTLRNRLELHTVAILIALALGGWMWGVAGAVIAVPFLVIVKVFCDHFPGLKVVGDFLAAETTTTEEAGEEAPAAVDRLVKGQGAGSSPG